jgi:hypothetical protein
MLVATGQIGGFLDGLRRDPAVPGEVQEAWQTALAILDVHARTTVLGRADPLL